MFLDECVNEITDVTVTSMTVPVLSSNEIAPEMRHARDACAEAATISADRIGRQDEVCWKDGLHRVRRDMENGASKATICANTFGVPAITLPLYR